MAVWNWCAFLVLWMIICETQNIIAVRVSEKIYDNIQGDLSCFKRLNGSHEVGCTSKFYGNVGVVHLVDNDTDVQWLIDVGTHAPYIVALTPTFFNPLVLRTLSASGKISGAVLLKTGDVPDKFSSDQHCPNEESSLYMDTAFDDYCKKAPWNPFGTSLLFSNWDFPIFLLDDEESIDKVLDCFHNFNEPDPISGELQNWPLCSMELKSNMYAATNAEVCLRRSQPSLFFAEPSFCEPLEDYNIWNSIKAFNASLEIQNDSIILVSTSADSSSIFDNRSPGAEAAVTGLISLLATADAIFKHKDDELISNDMNLMFAIFQGESWDYIGSSRMVYDMDNNQFPDDSTSDHPEHIGHVNISHIHSIIDIRQVGFGNKEMFLHTDPISNSDQEINDRTQYLLNIMKESSNGRGIQFRDVSEQMPLPPTSIQSFLKVKNISGVFISDHEKEYKNKYYESIYDDYENLNYSATNESDHSSLPLSSSLVESAEIIASSLYTMLTRTTKNIAVNASLVDDLLYCYLKNANCSFFRSFCDDSLLKHLYNGPAKMFVSVKREKNYLPHVTGRILSYLTGEPIEDYDESNCTSNSTQPYYLTYYPYINSGVCIKSTVQYTHAQSPAFIIEDYDWKSGEYSTWTESGWYLTGARIFLRPSSISEVAYIIGGVICTLLSIIVIYIFNSRAGTIFTSDIPPAPC